MDPSFMMCSYKVKACRKRNCSFPRVPCPFVHQGEEKRRDWKKYRYRAGLCLDFNNGSCKWENACRFAHGKVEKRYHPFVYRTRYCDVNSCKLKFCSYAHNSGELSSYTKNLEAINRNTDRNQPSARSQVSKFVVQTSPTDSHLHQNHNHNQSQQQQGRMRSRYMKFAYLMRDPVFMMCTYKTQDCSVGNCPFPKDSCTFAHQGETRRRDVRKYIYSNNICKYFNKGSCRKENTCTSAHGNLERWYHHRLFRTQLCQKKFPRNYHAREDSCKGKFCNFAHNIEDLSTPRENWMAICRSMNTD